MGWFSYRCFTCDDSMSLRSFIILYLVSLVLANFITDAYADYTPPTTYRTNDQYGAIATSSVQDTCTTAMPIRSQQAHQSNPLTGVSSCSTLTQTYTNTTQSYVNINAVYFQSQGGVTGSMSIGHAMQICLNGNTRKSGNYPNVICNGTPPPEPEPCLAGCTGACGQFYKFGTSTLPYTTCITGCKYNVTDGIQSSTGGWSGFVGRNLGIVCTPPVPAPIDAVSSPEYDCASKGQSYGTVNGAVVCVGKGTVGSAPTAEVKEPPKTTSTPAPTPENPNPAPVVSQDPPVVVTTTPAPAGSPPGTDPSVSSSSTKPDGSSTQKDESKESFCKDNPTSKLCKAETQCQENPDGPTCKHLCDKFPDSLACKDTDEFLEEAIGRPEDIPADDELEEKEIEAPLNFSRVSVPSANGCPPPQTVTVFGRGVSISYQWLCDYASAFKPLMIAFALMFAATVVMGGVRSDAQPFQRGLF